jgi:hypothetical protein
LRNVRPRILLPLLAAVMTLGWTATAYGDKIDRLIHILKTDSSYKVRLRVVVGLGKLKNRRAVPALIYALYDKNYTVRGLAAAALAQIGDRRAIYGLRRAAKQDKHGFVRARAKSALRVIERANAAKHTSRVRQRFFIKIGKMANRTGRGGRRPMRILEGALLRAFATMPDVTTTLGGGNPSADLLARKRIRGFTVDGTLSRLRRTRSAGSVTFSCSIRVALTTFPGNSIKALYSGETSMEVRHFRRSMERALLKDLFNGAAQEARRRIASSYLSSQ